MAEAQPLEDADKGRWEVKKLQAEVRKLEAETAAIAGPFWRKPLFWLLAVPALVVLLAALVGIGLQSYASSLDYRKAELYREAAAVEAARARDEMAKAKDLAAKAEADARQVSEEVRKATAQAKEATDTRDQLLADAAQLRQANGDLNKLLSENKAAFEQLSADIERLRSEKLEDRDLVTGFRDVLRTLEEKQSAVDKKAQEQRIVVDRMAGSKQ